MATKQNKGTDPKGGPESRDKSGRERGGEKSARQQRDAEGQFAGKRGDSDDPVRGTRESEDLDEDTDAEDSETFEQETGDEDQEEGVGREGKPAGRRPKGGS